MSTSLLECASDADLRADLQADEHDHCSISPTTKRARDEWAARPTGALYLFAPGDECKRLYRVVVQ